MSHTARGTERGAADSTSGGSATERGAATGAAYSGPQRGRRNV